MTNTNANNEKCKQWACASSEKGNFLLPKAEKVEQFYVKLDPPLFPYCNIEPIWIPVCLFWLGNKIDPREMEMYVIYDL